MLRVGCQDTKSEMLMLCLMSDAYQEEDYAKRLKSLMHLAELCVELLSQNDEHYADVCIPTNVSFNPWGHYSVDGGCD